MTDLVSSMKLRSSGARWTFTKHQVSSRWSAVRSNKKVAKYSAARDQTLQRNVVCTRGPVWWHNAPPRAAKAAILTRGRSRVGVSGTRKWTSVKRGTEKRM